MSPNRHTVRIVYLMNRSPLLMADRSEALVLTDESARGTAAGECGRGRCRGAARPVHQSRAVHQPGTLVAAFQPPGARRGREREPSGARTAAVPVDFGQQPRRILHGARRRPEGSGARGHRREEPGRADAGRAAGAHRRGGRRPCVRPAGALARAARGPAQGEHRPRRGRRRHQGREDLARGPLPPSHLPGADAARDRSGASVPVHSQSRLHHRDAACARERRARHERADPRARHARPVHSPARPRGRRRALHHAGASRPACSSRACSPATR